MKMAWELKDLFWMISKRNNDLSKDEQFHIYINLLLQLNYQAIIIISIVLYMRHSFPQLNP